MDAAGKVLGRLASEIARRLRGKHKPEFTPHVDTGDYIVVVNADKLRVTGRKAQNKIYHRHSGYPGGIYSDELRQAAGAPAGARAEDGGEGHAAQGPARLRDAEEDEGVCRREPSAHGAAAANHWRCRASWHCNVSNNYGTGRRKSAVARVFIKPGKGDIVVNGKPVDEFFSRETGRMVVRQPLELTKTTRQLRHHGQRRRRRRVGPGRRGAPRHHARADRVRCVAQAGAQEGGAGHARCARGRAQEGRPAQGAPRASSSRSASIVCTQQSRLRAALSSVEPESTRMAKEQASRIGIVGGTGYTGVELLRLLAQHPHCELAAITSRKEAGMAVAEMFPNLRGRVDAQVLRSGAGRARPLRPGVLRHAQRRRDGAGAGAGGRRRAHHRYRGGLPHPGHRGVGAVVRHEARRARTWWRRRCTACRR